MDPTHDPNFKPPSTNPDIEPPMSQNLIPNRQPIQPYVLADYLAPIDQPITHESLNPHQHPHQHQHHHHHSHSHHPLQTSARRTEFSVETPPRIMSPQSHVKHKIPKIPTELQPFSSSEEDDKTDISDELLLDGDSENGSAVSSDDDEEIERFTGHEGLGSSPLVGEGESVPVIGSHSGTVPDLNTAVSSATTTPTTGTLTGNITSKVNTSSSGQSFSKPTTCARNVKSRSDSFNTPGPVPPNLPRIHSYQIADLEEVPHGVQRQSKTLENYTFPTHRLKTHLTDPTKFPLVIVACGSFSPITYLHLRMFEMALDSIRESTRFEVIGGFYSPVSDNYKKQGLAPSHHRVRMGELACERTSSWLMVDAWESLQPKYTRTALVLDHFNEEINIKRGGVYKSKNSKEKVGVKIMLLAGGDLIESMGEPNVWAEDDLHHILGNYGCLIVERTGSDVRSFLLSHDIMYEHRKNILVIKQLIYNDISSTKVRLFIRRGMSVQYLLPNSVIRYIQEHNLYVGVSEPVKQVMKEKD
ncbi:unnamed protein product [Ambrosiozyma monospora]|uniref:Unnamed protein product n=1 Tax=Ambrosiozyma monospora TaxID=43982 RepID=A0A9W7DDM4_AMBMO|nr:unnamed protein product [Ambrosiozyma monospora]